MIIKKKPPTFLNPRHFTLDPRHITLDPRLSTKTYTLIQLTKVKIVQDSGQLR